MAFPHPDKDDITLLTPRTGTVEVGILRPPMWEHYQSWKRWPHAFMPPTNEMWDQDCTNLRQELSHAQVAITRLGAELKDANALLDHIRETRHDDTERMRSLEGALEEIVLECSSGAKRGHIEDECGALSIAKQALQL